MHKDFKGWQQKKVKLHFLVFRKFNKDILWALPISSSVVKNSEYYFSIAYKGLNQNVVLSQLRLLSSKRLLRKMGVLPVHDFENIAKKLQGLIKTKPPSADGGISEAEAHCD